MNDSTAPAPSIEDEALLTDAVRRAGELALTYFGKGLVGERKADHTPVSEADLAVDALLRSHLGDARPDYGWLSEETADNAQRLELRRVWIVDPIDGTYAFLAGKQDWTIAAALVEDGQPVLGAVFNPSKSEFYLARRGAGASLNGRPVRLADQREIEGARLIVKKSFLEQSIWREGWPEAELLWANSIAYRFALVAAGVADGTFALGGKSEWDLAAAALLVQEAGGCVTDAKGAHLRFNQPNPRINGMVAAAPGLHERLIARTRPVAADNI